MRSDDFLPRPSSSLFHSYQPFPGSMISLLFCDSLTLIRSDCELCFGTLCWNLVGAVVGPQLRAMAPLLPELQEPLVQQRSRAQLLSPCAEPVQATAVAVSCDADGCVGLRRWRFSLSYILPFELGLQLMYDSQVHYYVLSEI